MLQIGKINTLRVKGKRSYGVHLDGGGAGDILLLARDVPELCQEGDEIEVFVFVDREDRLQATTKTPLATVGEFAFLKVVADTPSGAFLDWGLGNDLFVPKGEQQHPMVEGQSYVVFVFLSERNNRITASSKLTRFLSPQPPNYEEGQEVELMVFEKTNIGYGALVNRAHTGMIYASEVFQKLCMGQELTGYIKKVREDLKLDLSLQPSGYQRVDDVSQAILKVLKEQGGRVSVTDKSPPDEVYVLFGVSKKVFKKAVGALYKKQLIILEPGSIRLTK